jgi:hypothetical protein
MHGLRLSAALNPSPPLPYHCSSFRGNSSRLHPAAPRATAFSSSRSPSLSRQMQEVTVLSPRLLLVEDAARATAKKLRAPLLSPSRRVCGRRVCSGDEAADLLAEGGLGAGPGRLRRRRSGGREQPLPFTTEDEEATNLLPPRFVATASFVSVSDLQRLPQIRTWTLRFIVLRAKSSVLEVRP